MTTAPDPTLHPPQVAPVEAAAPAVTGRSWLKIGIAFGVGLVAAAALGAGALYAYDRQYNGLILPGVRVGSVDVSGLSPSQASATLAQAYAGYGAGAITMTTEDGPRTIDFAAIKRGPDVEAMVAAAMVAGRGGNALEQAFGNARTALHGVTIQPIVTFDEGALTDEIRSAARSLDRRSVDAVISLTKEGYVVASGVDGRHGDHQATLSYLARVLGRTDAPAAVAVSLPDSLVEPAVTTADARRAVEIANRIADDVHLVAGKERWTLVAASFRAWTTFQPTSDGGLEPVVDRAKLEASVTKLGRNVNRSAVNASFKISGTKVTGVVASKTGRALDPKATTDRIVELLAARATGAAAAADVEPVLTVTQPSLTTAEAQAAAPLMRRVSTWTTYFPISEKNGFGNNIWIPAMDIDGHVVAPHEKFDFWDAVGPISRARGYRDGGAIINGRTEPQGALAGGICSCSTTLFNAALRAGYEMGARRNHYYYIDRYPLGLDATVFKSGSGSVQTMSWTNDTDYPVLIRGYKIRDGNRGYVRFDIYSVPTGRKVSFSKPIVRNVRPAHDSVQYTSALAPGVRKRVEYPVDGKDVWVTRTVRDKSGKVIHQETYYSHYSRITGIVQIGKGSTVNTTAAPAATPQPSPYP
jgi:vancomycin resistance protein YoaR